MGDDNNKKLYLVVGEIRGKIDRLSVQLESYFNELNNQIRETNDRISKLEETIQSHQRVLDELKTREKIYRASIVFIASVIVAVLLALFQMYF